jgi:hypothetical protein
MACSVPSCTGVSLETPLRLTVADALPNDGITASALRGLTTGVIGCLYRQVPSNRAKAVLDL